MKVDSRKTDPVTQGAIKPHPASAGKDAAFTMVEIALCLGVIAIALVAIIGVLPTGVRVQKDNREDTIINQEGLLWLEAIRSGSKGLDYLTNYVDLITVSNVTQKSATNYYNPAGFVPVPAPNTIKLPQLTNCQTIVELLTIPKIVPVNGILVTNRIFARVRAISGSAADKGRSSNARDFAFAYQLVSEVTPLTVSPPEYKDYTVPGLSDPEKIARTNLTRLDLNRFANFRQLRLTLQGPLIPRGTSYDVLGSPATFRALIGGRLIMASGAPGPLIQPLVFEQAP